MCVCMRNCALCWNTREIFLLCLSNSFTLVFTLFYVILIVVVVAVIVDVVVLGALCNQLLSCSPLDVKTARFHAHTQTILLR